MSTWKRILDLLIDPNIIALMLSIGADRASSSSSGTPA